MGEWGAADKNNLTDRLEYYGELVSACVRGGITPVAWIYSYNRNTMTWEDPELEEAIFNAYSQANVPILGGIEESVELKMYPNPAHDNLTVSLSAIPAKVQLLSTTGQHLQTIKPLSSIVQLDLSGLSNGIYLLQIMIDQRLISKRVVLE